MRNRRSWIRRDKTLLRQNRHHQNRQIHEENSPCPVSYTHLLVECLSLRFMKWMGVKD